MTQETDATVFKLAPLEAQSALWLKISRELERKLTVLREKNDRDHTLEETARIRGEIRAVKSMLEWASTTPTIS